MNNIKTIQTKYIDYIIGRKELGSLLNTDYDFSKNILISIINPENKFNIIKKQINLLENFINSTNNELLFPVYQEYRKFKKEKLTKRKAKKYLSSLNRYLNKYSNHFDLNAVPLNLKWQKRFFDVLTIDFWDVVEDLTFYIPISNEKAKEIAQFILKHKSNIIDKNLKFVIHCSAGVSRSAGVGMAIHCCLDFDGNVDKFKKQNCEIFYHKRYRPNEYVFEKVCGSYKKEVE